MLERIMGVFKLNPATFQEIEKDQNATTQAAIVVLLVGLLTGIGAAVAASVFNTALPAALEGLSSQVGESFDLSLVPRLSPVGAFINGLVGALLGWVVWSALTFFVGTRLFGGEADMGEMLRVIGFAQAPRLLSVFSFIPCLGGIISFAGAIWSLVAAFIGIREGLDLDTNKTLLTILVAFLGSLLISFLVGLVMGGIFSVTG